MSEATDARDAGLEKVNAPDAKHWMGLAYRALQRVACRMEHLTTDDVWAELEAGGIEGPRERRALGPVLMRAASAGIIEATNMVSNSGRKEAHAGPKRIWRSNIEGGAPPELVEAETVSEPPLFVVIEFPVTRGTTAITIGEYVAADEPTTTRFVPIPIARGWGCGCYRLEGGVWDKRCIKHTFVDPA
jgi:hypothetical protein